MVPIKFSWLLGLSDLILGWFSPEILEEILDDVRYCWTWYTAILTKPQITRSKADRFVGKIIVQCVEQFAMYNEVCVVIELVLQSARQILT